MSLDLFHPAVRRWFTSRFPEGPSAPQSKGWPAIKSGRNTLIAAPTGSGKTLAAFLSAIDDLVRQGVGEGAAAGGGTAGDGGGRGWNGSRTRIAGGSLLPDVTQVVYVSPLKALSNDIRKNLEEPLAGIRAELVRMGIGDVEIRTLVRTGDTPASERQAMLRRPPHILVTTPESLFILITTERGREMLQAVRTVIVDEIHAVADDKRGSHLALTLERLEHLVVHGASEDRSRRGAAASDPEGDRTADGPPQAEGAGLSLKREEESGAERLTLFDVPPAAPAHAGRSPVRIGLSATQQPIEEVARFLVGTRRVAEDGSPDCVVIDEGHVRDLDLRIEIPGSPLSALMSGEVWEEIYDRLTELIRENRTTLVFVNTRRLAERTVHNLSKRLGEELVTSHHGSLSRERRLDAEERLKAGKLRALVATASLELGIDIGSVDLVCQIGSPHTIATLVQRVGRSGRLRGAIAKGRLFALSRDELIECAALQLSVREGRLDRLEIPERPLDILAQQVVAAAASREWREDELFELAGGAHPFRALPREDFDAVARMLAEGYATPRGRRAAWIHHDAVNGRIRGRRGARLAAVSSGGAIPDNADFQVVLEPEGTLIGTLNEDFAIESMQGDIFQLGNNSWRILRIESGRVRVEDAHGQPPSIPFWLGEAPARTAELSRQVSRIRTEVEKRLPEFAATGESLSGARDEIAYGPGEAVRWLVERVGLERPAAEQIEEYLDAAKRVLTVVPTQETLVLERFFDEAGGMQLVIHAPFGGRINRAWGLAIRKRFCRSFNFELQAAANEDAIVLSLGPQHSFPLIDVFHYLNTATARELLVQALLAAPMFQTRWRWNAGRALGILRQRNGRKVPPQLLRMRSDDLLAAAFPQAAACLENVVGDITVPDHPIVRQTVEDCLVEAMDIDGLEALLGRIERGELRLVGRDVPEPSPLAHEILNARPYAFLDDAPAEERRTLAVSTRRSLEYRTADDLGTLDSHAIERVRREAWPEPENADEAHDALLWLGFVTEAEGEPWTPWLRQLEGERRATLLWPAALGTATTQPTEPPDTAAGEIERGRRRSFWVAAERLPPLAAVFGSFTLEAPIEAPAGARERAWDRGEALVEVLRGRIEGLGPMTAAELAETTGLPVSEIDAALIALEAEGTVLRGHFTAGLSAASAAPDPSGESSAPSAFGEHVAPVLEWCHRRLLSRIHRYTIERLRSEIEPATSADFMRFLLAWQHVHPARRLEGPRGLLEALRQLQGFEAPALAWEREILPARLREYDPAWLDALCLSGEVTWGRLVPPAPPAMGDGGRSRPRSGPIRSSPIAFLMREDLATWMSLTPAPRVNGERLSHAGWEVYRALGLRGASFLQELVARTNLLPSQVERGLAELVSWGMVTADGVSGLRALLLPDHKRGGRQGGARSDARSARRLRRAVGNQAAGRWSLLREPAVEEEGAGLTNGDPLREAGGHTADLRTAAGGRAPDPREAASGRAEEEREAAVEALARQLLARYGIVVRRVLEREPLLPPWRELLRVLRRLEMRGEIRGGRFLQSAAGEQFALPEAVELLRSLRRGDADQTPVPVNGGDPLNLAGIVTAGERVPALPWNRVLYRGGVPVAVKEGKELRHLVALGTEAERREVHALLTRVRALGSPPGADPAGRALPLFPAS
jgi:ATP-dependent Lhr-like helicase